MPAGLYADWNDCLRLGADGESTFVALQFYYAMTILKSLQPIRKMMNISHILMRARKTRKDHSGALLERGQIYPWIYRGWTGYRKA